MDHIFSAFVNHFTVFMQEAQHDEHIGEIWTAIRLESKIIVLNTAESRKDFLAIPMLRTAWRHGAVFGLCS